MTGEKYARRVIRINTKVTNWNEIQEITKPLINYANKREVDVVIGYNKDHSLICECIANGITTAYCKGVCAEIQEALKRIFRCKLDVVLYEY